MFRDASSSDRRGRGAGRRRGAAGRQGRRTIDPGAAPETVAKQLYESLNDAQRRKSASTGTSSRTRSGACCGRASRTTGTSPSRTIGSDFYTKDQQAMIKHIFESIIQPDWHKRIDKQLEDDAGGYGEQQSIAMFGKPGDKFEFVMTGRHMTLRCDGNTTSTWPSAGRSSTATPPTASTRSRTTRATSSGPRPWRPTRSTRCSTASSASRRWSTSCPAKQAVASEAPAASSPAFAVTEMSSDQKGLVQGSAAEADRALSPERSRRSARLPEGARRARTSAALAFYSDGDVGNDEVWDSWRLEGPSFVWYFRGAPHVHVWVNVADDPDVKLNA